MWRFKKIEPGMPERHPRESEFFRLTEPDEAVVREFIQNALDARYENETVGVRIYLGDTEQPRSFPYLDILVPHLCASDFDLPCDSGKISFLTIEDFGTTGLNGDTGRSDSNFYNFWWREGISDKSGRSGGRWGLGKTTFHLVSQIRTFWGITMRRDDNRTLLMGKTLLKPHEIGHDVFDYAGYFCTDGWNPIEDNNVIREFKRDFNVKRNADPGLSIVIPFPVSEISLEGMVRSVLRHYFYAIIAGKLRVELCENGSEPVVLDGNNLIEVIHSVNWKGTDWENIDVENMINFVRSAVYNTESRIELNVSDMGSPEITENSFSDLEDLREKFRGGDVCHFRVPVEVRPMGQRTGMNTYISIHVQKILGLPRPMEFYVRSGILITDLKTLGNRPVFALLLADDEPVARFLGDCETPAHTNWNERTEGFKEKYENAVNLLRFIKKCIVRTVSILDEPPSERQIEFLKDVFSIPLQEEEKGKKEGSGKPPEKIESEEPLFIVNSVKQGFSVLLNPLKYDTPFPFPFPFRAIIRMAYDTRRGNPFAQYERFDFDVGSDSISISEQTDCVIHRKEGNLIEIEVKGKNLKLTVKGFHPERDLVVAVKKVES